MKPTDFIWEKFVDEPRGAVKQIISFLGDIGFFESLWDEVIGQNGFDEQEVMYVILMDTDLRMPDELKESPGYQPSRLEEFTIELETN